LLGWLVGWLVGGFCAGRVPASDSTPLPCRLSFRPYTTGGTAASTDATAAAAAAAAVARFNNLVDSSNILLDHPK